MSLVLTTTWQPRGELARLKRCLPRLLEVYSAMVVALPPDSEQGLFSELVAVHARLQAFRCPEWPAGRCLALKAGVAQGSDFIHYADLDRLVRWVETRPAEWRAATEALQKYDYTIFGRSDAAYATHPQSMRMTEAISNLVVGQWLGRTLDISAGSKGFSQSAARIALESCDNQRPIGSDAAWTLALHLAGIEAAYIEVDGLDWEIPDQYQEHAADVTRQQRIAAEYDADPTNWTRRVNVAMEVVESAFEVVRKIDPLWARSSRR
jgi:hypothetical protein